MNKYFKQIKSIILISCFLIAAYTAKSQTQEIKITILDSLSNKPIPYASLVSIENKSGKYTNEYGVFYTDNLQNPVVISHIGYYSKTVYLSDKNDTVKLQPHTYILDEITVNSVKKKFYKIGYLHHKSYFTVTGVSGYELAVYIENAVSEEKNIQEVRIGFDTKNIIKKDLGVDFVSVFRINLYSKEKNTYMPGEPIFTKDNLVFTSDIIKKKTKIDISKYNIMLPPEGLFISIEWIGIENKDTKKLITDYKGRTEPFLSTTFDKTNTYVYERNKFKDHKWKLVSKDHKYSIVLKKDNYFTPRINLIVY